MVDLTVSSFAAEWYLLKLCDWATFPVDGIFDCLMVELKAGIACTMTC